MKTNKILLILLILVFVNTILAEELTLNVGESKDINGNIIKLRSLKSNKALISVNDQSQILEENKEEIIGPLKVEVLEIFYVTDSEGHVRLTVTPLYVCGDGNCNGPETKETCCQDCGCQAGYDCEDNKCLVHVENQCNNDEECDDNNPTTSDRCTGRPKKCVNSDITICRQNSDCEDNNPCTTDNCINNDCFNKKIEGCENQEETKEVKEEVDNELEEETVTEDQDKETQPKKEKISFFRRIINFFKNLF